MYPSLSPSTNSVFFPPGLILMWFLSLYSLSFALFLLSWTPPSLHSLHSGPFEEFVPNETK